MRHYKKIIRACLLYVLVVITATGYPLSAFADVAPTSGATTQSTATAPPQETYTFNPVTKHWDSNQWQFDPVSGQYVRPPVIVPPVAPAPAAPVAPVTPGLANPTASTTTTTTPSTSVSSAGPSTSSSANLSTNTGIENNLVSQAQTGNAGVQSNTAAGSATSGDAAATTTVVNAVHSTVQGGTAGVAHFSADINGNVTGDITLAPALSDALSQTSARPADTTIQAASDTSLTNNISLGATSGNANVADNTKAGSATTGTANTVANVINLINSIIAANQSFVGTINIYGNLNGDILISPSFIPQLLASNATNGDNSPTSTVLGTEDTQSIINNVSLNAASGTADVANNTKAGSATTGTAATNLTILNYAGHQVVASNSLLIFVNVLGKWVGIIVDAPVGATAAVLGNGVKSNVGSGGDQTIDANNKSAITNNIDLTSLSGNASVTGNTSAGNATSGNATASANIANISTSSFSVSDWFGVLFINVFGTWLGSFGVDTENGTITPVTTSPVTPLSEAPANTVRVPQFGFRSHGQSRTGVATTEIITPSAQAETASTLISEPQTAAVAGDVPVVISEAPQKNPYSFVMIMASLLGAVIAAAIGLYRRQDSFPV